MVGTACRMAARKHEAATRPVGVVTSKMTMRPQMAAMWELERYHHAAAPAMVLESRLPDGA
jgi:hypothetical protein